MTENKKSNENRKGYWERSNHTYDRDAAFYSPLKDVKSFADLDRLFQQMNAEFETEIQTKYTGVNACQTDSSLAPKKVMLTCKQVVEEFPIGERRLKSLAKERVIPSSKDGKKYIFLKEDIEDFFLKSYNGKKQPMSNKEKTDTKKV